MDFLTSAVIFIWHGIAFCLIVFVSVVGYYFISWLGEMFKSGKL